MERLYRHWISDYETNSESYDISHAFYCWKCDAKDFILRVKDWSRRIQEVIEGDKGTVEAVHGGCMWQIFWSSTIVLARLTITSRPHSLQEGSNYLIHLDHSTILTRAANPCAFIRYLGLFWSLFNDVHQCKADLKVVLKLYTGRERKAGWGPTFSTVLEEIYFTTFNLITNELDDKKERLQRIVNFIQEIQHSSWSQSQAHTIETTCPVPPSLSRFNISRYGHIWQYTFYGHLFGGTFYCFIVRGVWHAFPRSVDCLC